MAVEIVSGTGLRKPPSSNIGGKRIETTYHGSFGADVGVLAEELHTAFKMWWFCVVAQPAIRSANSPSLVLRASGSTYP